MLLAELDKRITLEVGVRLNLVHCRLYLGIGQAVSGEEDVIVAAWITPQLDFVLKSSIRFANVTFCHEKADRKNIQARGYKMEVQSFIIFQWLF
jgi:hypothetical protein